MATRKRASDRGGPPEADRPTGGEDGVQLHELAQTRYLNYALSVITARALPDVRDGLKPVQRRILYGMWLQRLTSDAKHSKCAAVVGRVMGDYHPHGDASIYDALVRLAQSFSMRVPLVNGSGNFGSLDGDPPAAYRYTECRLAPIATELLTELGQNTVEFRPSYDGQHSEPVVLPARLPNLLINGTTGIAVGMATSIPPHNPEEIGHACIRLLESLTSGKEIGVKDLCRSVKGPDFPTGGQIVSTPEELLAIYETGQGSVKLRGTWKALEDRQSRTSKFLEITSIPYALDKSTLVERIAEVITARKMPLLLDVRDLSGEDVHIELELKKDADEHKVLAYLFKHTPLQTNFQVNLTCLVPTENPEVGRPDRLDLRSILWHFLQFRMEVVTRRLKHELAALEKRLHLLAGLEKIFDALDEIIRIIRKSDGKADAAQKIIKRFGLDEEQTDYILELKLYRLARLEVLVVREEAAEKRKRAAEINKLLREDGEKSRWQIVRTELEAAIASLGPAKKRRTVISAVADEPEFTAEDLIIAEDNYVIVTRDGWVKRQREIKDLGSTRIREGDEVLACVLGSTRATVVFFSQYGAAYTCRLADIPATTGYGEPIQKLFKLRDGEFLVNALSLDTRITGELSDDPEYYPETFGLAVTSDGYSMGFGFAALVEPSTRQGRKFAKLSEGATIVSVLKVHGDETLISVTRKARAQICAVNEINFLAGAGRGVTLMKLDDDDSILGVKLTRGERDPMVVKTNLGGEQNVGLGKFEVTSRGGRGREVLKRGSLVEVVRDPVTVPEPLSGSSPSTPPRATEG